MYNAAVVSSGTVPVRQPIIIRDRDHFYKIVSWCIRNIGKGKRYWTIDGRRVLRLVDPTNPRYNPPVHCILVVNVPGIDLSGLMAL